MAEHTYRTIERVIIGDGQSRTFVVGHAFASLVAVHVRETGDKDVSVDVAYTSPTQVTVIFDSVPAAGKPFIASLSGR